EIHLVEEIERLDPQLNVLAAAHLYVLDSREVGREDSRTEDRTAADVPECAERIHLKRRHVEPLGGAALIARQCRVHAADNVWPVVAVRGERLIKAVRHGERESR